MKGFIEQAQSRQQAVISKQLSLKKVPQFDIRDMVLIYRSQLDNGWSRKMELQWTEQHIIHDIKANGTYQLKNIEGCHLVNLVHRN